MILGFAPFGYWVLVFVSLTLLLWIWTTPQSVTRASWRGFLFGISLYGVGLHWFLAISNTFSPQHQTTMQVITYSIFFILACYPAVLGLLLTLVKNRLSITWMIGVFPILWTLFENLRSWFLTGLSLYQPSYALLETPFSGYAALGGELLVNLTVLICISSFIFFLRSQSKHAFLIFSSVLGIIWILGTYLNTVIWGANVTKTLDLRLIHGTPDSRIKTRHYFAIDTIDQYLKFSKALPRPALVVWPESALAIDFRKVKKHLVPKAKELNHLGIDILLGSYTTKNRLKYNTVLQAAQPNNHYHKQHLIPFGEYMPNIPFINLQNYLPKVEMGNLAARQIENKQIEIQDISFATAICYEVIFGSEYRDSWKGSDVLLFVSDLSWFKNTWAADQLLQIARLRAKESAKPLLSSTNFGVTAIVDAKGQLVNSYHSLTKTSYIDGKITIRKGQTPYSNYGNRVVIGVALSYLLLLLLFNKSQSIPITFYKK